MGDGGVSATAGALGATMRGFDPDPGAVQRLTSRDVARHIQPYMYGHGLEGSEESGVWVVVECSQDDSDPDTAELISTVSCACPDRSTAVATAKALTDTAENLDEWADPPEHRSWYWAQFVPLVTVPPLPESLETDDEEPEEEVRG